MTIGESIKLRRVRARLLYFYGHYALKNRYRVTLGTSSLCKLLEIPEEHIHSEILHVVKEMKDGVKATWKNSRLTLEYKPAGSPPIDERHVMQVFQHWQNRLGKDKHKLTGKRKKAIIARLREGYSVQDLRRAIDGMSCDSFHNPTPEEREKGAKAWDDIELVCRDGDHVEKFRDMPVRKRSNTLVDRLREKR